MVEEPESLLFTNLGEFLPGSVEQVIRMDSPPEFYRNRILTEAMVSYNMIDTIGSGIKRMFTKQRERFFPLPDYDRPEAGRVTVRVFGKVLDERYTRILIEKTDLGLGDGIALDTVQKKQPLSDAAFHSLKRTRLIEGRRPNLSVSASVAAATETKADYIRKRAFDKQHYVKLVHASLAPFRRARRADIDSLLLDKISDALGPEQQRTVVPTLLQEMRRKNNPSVGW